MRSKLFTFTLTTLILFGAALAQARPVMIPVNPADQEAGPHSPTGTVGGPIETLEAKHKKYLEFITDNYGFGTMLNLEDISARYDIRCNPSLVPAGYGGAYNLDNTVTIGGFAEATRCLFHFVAITDPKMIELKLLANQQMKILRNAQAYMIIEENLWLSPLTSATLKQAHHDNAMMYFWQFKASLEALQQTFGLIRDRFHGAVKIYGVGYMMADATSADPTFNDIANNFAELFNASLEKTMKYSTGSDLRNLLKQLLSSASLSTVVPLGAPSQSITIINWLPNGATTLGTFNSEDVVFIY